MSEWVAIQKTTHKNARWENHTHYNFAKTSAVAPVLLAELTQLLPYYPLAFVKTSEAATENFQLVALLSIQPGVNYYANIDGKWRVPYVPSTFRSHPFKLVAKNPEEFVLCLDQTSEFLSLTGETSYSQPLFSISQDAAEKVELAEPVTQVLNFLQQCQANQQLTQQAVNLLAKHNLIQPWEIEQAAATLTDAEIATGKTQAAATPVKGVFQINTEALQQLTGEALAELNQHKALELAYAQLFSKPRLQAFAGLSNLHQQEQEAHLAAENLDLEHVFGEQEDDLFRF